MSIEPVLIELCGLKVERNFLKSKAKSLGMGSLLVRGIDPFYYD
jgi:hypothetical protein